MPGPCDSVGVQLKTPVTGSMLAPSGAPESRLKVREFAGRSASFAVLVKVSKLPSLIVLLAIGAKVGAALASVTPMVMVSATVAGGIPLSVTRMVTGLVLGP